MLLERVIKIILVGSDITGIDVSVDSRYLLCGASITDYSVKVIDLYTNKNKQDLTDPLLHISSTDKSNFMGHKTKSSLSQLLNTKINIVM